MRISLIFYYRYKKNNSILRDGMLRLGFTELVPPEHAGHIITSFKYPNSKNFDFEVFYNKLKDRGELLFWLVFLCILCEKALWAPAILLHNVLQKIVN